ncbi:MAG: di-heme oxidoredictase family protein [Bdellovibrionota bacterium]|nr:MAG: di-heme oxidoredictase family protein [Bdellovibrionota bacterium]
MRKLAVAPATALVSLLLTVSAWAQDITNLGGDLTSDLPIDTALELPAPNISSEELFQLHLAGHTDFHGSFLFTKLNGKRVLGPHFNHNSCGACHVKDGRGPIRISSRPPGSSVLVKVSLRGLNPDGSPRDVPRVGEQLQNHSIDGSTRYDIRLRWRTVRGVYPDGTKYTLRRPQLSFKIPGIRSTKVVHSIRMSPPTIGMGLLEAVPAATIVAMSDPDDLDGDGISGRVSYVPNLETGQIEVGRFGWRATQPTLKQQAAAAFFHDMGLTNELFLPEGKAQEIPDEQLARVVFYSQAAGVTPARDQDHPDVVAGKALFQQINCDSCHVMTLQTGDSEVVEVANQEFHPFTDLLLHDMGPDLADERPEFSATQREWRTPPLWGLGLHPFLSSKRPGYLHDGRARTIEEAILWHGGEALSSRESFKDLSAAERFQLIRFLQSL